jgi:D-glycero-D-manno-heptose 1,7-bisphosphate phosphatase
LEKSFKKVSLLSAIFLDRDGVIIQKAPDGEYVADWCEVKFLAGSLDAIAEFNRFGYKVMIVTNQRGVATGKIQLTKVKEIHTRLREVIAGHGGKISGIYFCPHDTLEGCTCRKPKPGMLLQAAAEHKLRLSKCWMVGDASTDIAAGKSAGCKTALITRSEGFQRWTEKPDIWAKSLALAARRILAEEPGMNRAGM